jgi:hypothetical protein
VNRLACSLVASLAAIVSLPVAMAERLDAGRVPAKAVWMMHFDMDTARDSVVLKRMEARMLEKYPQAEKMMAMGAGMIGMDVRKDLHDVTVYGLDTDKKNAVMIVHADADRKKLEAMVAKAPGHETMDHRGYTLHAWTHKGWKQTKGQPVVGAFYKDNVMVFARTKGQVEMALDVLDGKAKSLGEDSPLAGRTKPGSILVGRAAAIDPQTKCPVLREGKGYRVALGESEGMSFYRARLDMNSAAAAEQAKSVTEGLAALGMLRFGREADVTKLVKAAETTVRGDVCTISWDAKADDVWKVVERAAATMEAKMAERKKQWAAMKGKSGCQGCEKGKCEQAECPMEKKEGTSQDARRPFRDDEF